LSLVADPREVTADEEAARLEHAVSDVVEKRLYEVLGRPATCPHGNPIPGYSEAAPNELRLTDVRAGARASITLALALIGVFGVARALVPSAVGVILLTVPVGIGVAVAGSLMPGAVKEAWPERPARPEP